MITRLIGAAAFVLMISAGASALTVTLPAGIPLQSEKVKEALIAKDAKIGTLEGELLVYSYSTGKAVYTMNKKGELEIKEEPGKIEAVIKLKSPKGASLKPIFISGYGLDAASLTTALVAEVLTALKDYL